MVRMVTKVRLAHQAFRVRKVFKVFLVHKATTVTTAIKARPVFRG